MYTYLNSTTVTANDNFQEHCFHTKIFRLMDKIYSAIKFVRIEFHLYLIICKICLNFHAFIVKDV